MAATTEFAFRAQLVIPEQRQIFDYWMSRSKDGRMPSRRDINPCDFPRLLPLVSLVDVEKPNKRLRVRLAGTRLREYYGCDMTGIYLDEVDYGSKADYWQSAFHRVTVDGRPAQGVVRGPGENREHLAQFWLKLPLSDDGENVSMILSYDAFVPVATAQLFSETDGFDASLMAPNFSNTARMSSAF